MSFLVGGGITKTGFKTCVPLVKTYREREKKKENQKGRNICATVTREEPIKQKVGTTS